MCDIVFAEHNFIISMCRCRKAFVTQIENVIKEHKPVSGNTAAITKRISVRSKLRASLALMYMRDGVLEEVLGAVHGCSSGANEGIGKPSVMEVPTSEAGG